MANKQLKNHFRAYEAMQLDAHFEERDLKFKQMELDPVTGQSNGIKWSGFVSSCHVCMYVCMYVYLSVCVHVCLPLRTYTASLLTMMIFFVGLILIYLIVGSSG